jgi:hypothetical protein
VPAPHSTSDQRRPSSSPRGARWRPVRS